MKKSIVSLALFSSFIFSNYIPESNQPLYQLQTNANNFQGELAYEVADDGVSPAIDLSFNFTFTIKLLVKRVWQPMAVCTLKLVALIVMTTHQILLLVSTLILCTLLDRLN